MFSLRNVIELGSHMHSGGVPQELLPFVIALEVGGAAALIAGWKARWTAAALAIFTLAAASIADGPRSCAGLR